MLQEKGFKVIDFGFSSLLIAVLQLSQSSQLFSESYSLGLYLNY